MSYPYLAIPSKAGVFVADMEDEDAVGSNRVYIGVHNKIDHVLDKHVDLVRVQDYDDGSKDVEICVYGNPGSLEPTYTVRISADDIKEALGE